MNEHFAYLVGALLFASAWVACFVIGKTHRPQMIWGSLVSAPFALTSILFIPQYWTPPSLFDLDKRIKVGIEDFIWAAAVGGIASVIGEIILKERLAKSRKQARKKHYLPFIVLAVLLVTLQLWRPGKTIYNMIISLTICVVVVLLRRPDLILVTLAGAADFTLLYFALFIYFLLLYPDFVQRYYNVPNLLGIYVWKVPIEELLFAASGGAVWSAAYEYLQGYRLAPEKGFRLVQI